MKSENDTGAVLFLIAHPDDDFLFFYNVIHKRKQESKNVYLMTITDGGYKNSKITYDLNYALERICELRNVCENLYNIKYIAYKSGSYQKDHDTINETEIANYIYTEIIPQFNITEIITFDEKGQTGHKDHISLYYAVLKLANTYSLLKNKTQLKITLLLTPRLFSFSLSYYFFFPLAYFIASFSKIACHLENKTQFALTLDKIKNAVYCKSKLLHANTADKTNDNKDTQNRYENYQIPLWSEPQNGILTYISTPLNSKKKELLPTLKTFNLFYPSQQKWYRWFHFQSALVLKECYLLSYNISYKKEGFLI